MIDNFVNEYIRQRMQEKGFGEYHREPVLVSVTGGQTANIPAYNEYYYLVSSVLAEDTLIVGDTHFIVARDYANQTFARLHEFTGNITIDSPADANIEFIRVIPLS